MISIYTIKNKIYYFIRLTTLIILYGCSSNSSSVKQRSLEQPIPPDNKNQLDSMVIESRTFQNQDSTWGYMILIDNKPFIKQERIPALPGTKGFLTQEDALNVASLVIGKLKINQNPPSVTIKELTELGIKRPN